MCFPIQESSNSSSILELKRIKEETLQNEKILLD